MKVDNIIVFILLALFWACGNETTDMVFDSEDMSDGNTSEKNHGIVIFLKESNVDWTKPENQDRITENVWLTRANEGLLFNILVENSSNGEGPTGTLWFEGTLQNYTQDQIDTLPFTSLKEAASSRMRDVVGKTFIVHLIQDDIYIDLNFRAWSDKSGGAGFSYSRTAIQAL